MLAFRAISILPVLFGDSLWYLGGREYQN